MRPPLAALRVESQGVPSSWGTLLCLCRVLRPRRDQNHQAIPWSDAAPVYAKDEGCPRVSQSRGSVARPQHSLSTLRPVHHWPRRKTRFRLPARLYRVGLVTHRVPMKGFMVQSSTSVLLSQAFLAQCQSANRRTPRGKHYDRR